VIKYNEVGLLGCSGSIPGAGHLALSLHVTSHQVNSAWPSLHG